jgi:hypothetical protein
VQLIARSVDRESIERVQGETVVLAKSVAALSLLLFGYIRERFKKSFALRVPCIQQADETTGD